MKHPRFIAIVMGLVLGGCSSGNTSGVGISSPAVATGEAVLEVDNSALARDLELHDVKERYQGDLLQVQATLASLAGGELFLQYKFSWFDTQGFAVEPQQDAWIPVKLHGHQQVSLQGLAPAARAIQYKIYVREVIN